MVYLCQIQIAQKLLVKIPRLQDGVTTRGAPSDLPSSKRDVHKVSWTAEGRDVGASCCINSGQGIVGMKNLLSHEFGEFYRSHHPICAVEWLGVRAYNNAEYKPGINGDKHDTTGSAFASHPMR